MKMNKLAAGALALALGLGAVAPAVAAEETKYSGAELVLEKYEEELKEVNKKRAKYLVASAKISEAEKRLDAAKAKVAEKEKAYRALFPAYVQVIDENGKPIPVSALATREVEEAQRVLNGLLKDGKVDYKGEKGAVKVDWIKSVADKTVNPDTLDAAIERYVNAYNAYTEAMKETPGNPRLLAYQELQAALLEKDAAITNLKEVKAKYGKDVIAYENAFDVLSKLAAQYGFVVQVGNNGVKLVKDGEDKVKVPGAQKSKEELVKALKAAIEKNKVAIASAEFLLENAPKSVAKVKDKLLKQIVDAKAIIEKSEKALAKYEKVALVATAYADETTDELESLIKENEESADAINETIKENEKEQPEVDEEEEKKPEEKEEEKKPENKPARQAGTNARTGIAGVAGVAGILAAASVAYAASKRD